MNFVKANPKENIVYIIVTYFKNWKKIINSLNLKEASMHTFPSSLRIDENYVILEFVKTVAATATETIQFFKNSL